MPKFHLTPKGYTRTGIWSLIDDWLERLLSIERRKERAEARKREEAAARERIRRENAASMPNRTAAAFDRRMADRRKTR